ncbi:LytTR family DNA-binding domain-containing protein [Flavihumibacter rivuli]|uniref:LytR/AlgR family response regulator transcription factor n=1 Tax=Flavihumibacter rivuli TaxID=2838156 RepID=UPI001BDF2337|nr:LytTR family DNA-binding domain-containing protein [Flavihumibacter rivuli]ULQ56956.1 LytTR family DNA-binding domain-containing protein [Flavihumibacter rivuli]
MKVLIVEDELLAVNRLIRLLLEIDPSITIMDTIHTVREAGKFLQQDSGVDLVFMDIELEDGHSLQLFQRMVIPVPVIFVTAYQEYAVKAFKANGIDYLLKPLEKNALEDALDKYNRLQSPGVLNGAVRSLIEQVKVNHAAIKQRFLAKRGTRLISVPVNTIAFFYVKDRNQFIKTTNNEDILIDLWLDDIEPQLDERFFFRVNRQFIICYNHIDTVHLWYNGKLKVKMKPESHEHIIVSRLRSVDFKIWLGQ